MNEWYLEDKMGDIHYFKDIKSICDYLDLSKGVVYNIFLQSIKHYNKYTIRGYYIQRLYNNPHTHQRKQFFQDKYIYYIDNEGNNEWGVKFNND